MMRRVKYDPSASYVRYCLISGKYVDKAKCILCPYKCRSFKLKTKLSLRR